MNRLAILIVGAVLGASCASYGFVDSPADADSGPSLAVETLAAPAHLGLNHSELRSLLIDELEIAGVQVVDSSSTHVLMCTITDHRTTGFERDLVAEMDVACDIRAADADSTMRSFEATGLSTDQLGEDQSLPRSALGGTRRAGMTATADAFGRLAPDIADAVEEFEDRPPADAPTDRDNR